MFLLRLFAFVFVSLDLLYLTVGADPTGLIGNELALFGLAPHTAPAWLLMAALLVGATWSLPRGGKR